MVSCPCIHNFLSAWFKGQIVSRKKQTSGLFIKMEPMHTVRSRTVWAKHWKITITCGWKVIYNLSKADWEFERYTLILTLKKNIKQTFGSRFVMSRGFKVFSMSIDHNVMYQIFSRHSVGWTTLLWWKCDIYVFLQ